MNYKWFGFELLVTSNYTPTLSKIQYYRLTRKNSKIALKLSIMKVILIDSEQKLKEQLSLIKTESILGIDTEVFQPNFYTNHLLTVQISNGGIVWVINCQKILNISSLNLIFNDAKQLKVFQNAVFDIQILKQVYNFEFNNIYDTFLAEKILTAGNLEESNLQAITKKYLDKDIIKNWKDLNFESIYNTKEINQEQLNYSAIDALVLPEIYLKQFEKIKEQNLEKVLNLEHQVVFVVVEMQMRGTYVNKDSWQDLIVELQKERDKINQSVQTQIAQFYNVESLNMFEDSTDYINLNSPKQVLDLFNNKLKINIKSTREYEIEKLDHPIAKLLLRYREHEKLLKAFGENLLDKISPITNRIHPEYRQLGSDTGRFSCSNPNFQQIPKGGVGKKIREFFIPEKGNKYVIADYSQQELRILAFYSKDPEFLKSFQQDIDLHRLTASKLFNVDFEKVTSEQRASAKTLNFGIIYGMGPRALASSLDIDFNQGKDLLDKYNITYKFVREFLDRSGNEAIAKGYTTTLYGRKRFYDVPREKSPDYERMMSGIKRAAMNHPIQGTGADMIKLALVAISKRLKEEGLQAQIINTIHDEIMIECIESDAIKTNEIIQNQMINAGNKILPNIPIKVESRIVDSWGESE